MTLTGPRLEARSGKASSLVVFLHGFGSDGKDLISIGREWQRLFPDTAFVAPNAPERCTMAGAGYQWFGLTFRSLEERLNGVRAARPALEAFLDAELARYGLSDADLCLVGFSQGTMMALHTGLRRARPAAAIIGYSGTLVAPELLKSEVTVRPPLLLVHGDQDTVIPVDALLDAADGLCAAEIPAQWHLSLGVGHGIDPQGLMHGALFLAEALGVKMA